MTVATKCIGPASRREFMSIGALALGGLTLADVLAVRAATGNQSADTSVIMLYQNGGASQLETYDLKPGAPTEYRSQFQPIATNVAGIDICEMFPLQARTPKMRYGPPERSYGRDHWPQAFTALLSGGGLQMGQVVGATNHRSEHPVECPYTPQDLLATIYRHLGIDYGRTFNDFSGRPVHILSEAKPIRELL